MMMKRILVACAGLAAFALAACDPILPTVNLASQVNLNTIQGVVAGYGLVLNAENTLKQLPLCKTGTSPGVTNICVRRSVIVRLQAADRVAYAAVNSAVSFVKANPKVEPSGYIGAARDALMNVQSILNEAGSAAPS